ncbi:CHAP domain-containing protein [uncultured Ruminococcus sp.]|uniref:CHAP domain-containing protein n=1 Tax=uncultured Ruminococcus sp. TaxID=165186 RepID=UPI0025E7C7E1|nr:CHAP domain-containing protein [uncultured Ruminococcus sp.]
MKRVMAVTAAAIMAITGTAVFTNSEMRAAADAESFDYGDLIAVSDDENSADEETTSDEESCGIKGDVNGDGKINVTDIAKAAAAIKGLSGLDTESLWRADITCDNKFNVTDLSKICWTVRGGKRGSSTVMERPAPEPVQPAPEPEPIVKSPAASLSKVYDNAVGTRLANLYSGYYNIYGWPNGQCTWYCLGRSNEKLGVDMTLKGLTGNAINWYYNAQRINPASVGTEIRSDCVCVCSSWTHGYGHVVYIEYVDPDTGAIYFSQANRLGWATNYADNGKIEKADSYADFVAQMNWLYLSPVGFVYPDLM